jgi:hypothetical protein
MAYLTMADIDGWKGIEAGTSWTHLSNAKLENMVRREGMQTTRKAATLDITTNVVHNAQATPCQACDSSDNKRVGASGPSQHAYLWYSLSLFSSSETSCKWSWKPRKVLIHIPLPFRGCTHHNLHATKPPTPRNLQRFASASKAATSMCVHRTVYTILDK